MYRNPFASGYEVFSKTSYMIDSHGSLANTPQYLITNDFPNYAGMFYSPTEHEVVSQIKYGNFAQDYSNLREIQASLNGPPIEFYIPSPVSFPDGAGKQTSSIPHITKFNNFQEELLKKFYKEASREIIKAQEQAKNANVSKIKIEFEETLMIRKTRKTITFEQRG